MASDRDQRAAGVQMLGQLMPLPGNDAEAQAERKLLRRMDHREAVRHGPR